MAHKMALEKVGSFFPGQPEEKFYLHNNAIESSHMPLRRFIKTREQLPDVTPPSSCFTWR
jgi:hypothetical protein